MDGIVVAGGDFGFWAFSSDDHENGFQLLYRRTETMAIPSFTASKYKNVVIRGIITVHFN